MNRELSVIVLVMLVIAACTATSSSGEITHASFGAPQLGIVTDGEMRVIELRPHGAADIAGVQIGDILLDLTWIPFEEPTSLSEASGVIYTDTGTVSLSPGDGVTEGMPLTTVVGSIVVTRGVVVTPIPPAMGSYIDKETVPFAESDRIRSLTVYGVPLLLRLLRNGQVIEFTITPSDPPIEPIGPNMPMATFTPVMPPNHYY